VRWPETAQVDALDEKAVVEYADAVAQKAGGIDASFNAIFNGDVQGNRWLRYHSSISPRRSRTS
jgi:hypothetical protein